jgi:hypothetical protein
MLNRGYHDMIISKEDRQLKLLTEILVFNSGSKRSSKTTGYFETNNRY